MLPGGALDFSLCGTAPEKQKTLATLMLKMNSTRLKATVEKKIEP